jgi:hypothetical protein
MLKEFIEITYLHKETIKLLDNSDRLNNCEILVSKDKNIIVNTEFNCEICNKDYKSYQSL